MSPHGPRREGGAHLHENTGAVVVVGWSPPRRRGFSARGAGAAAAQLPSTGEAAQHAGGSRRFLQGKNKTCFLKKQLTGHMHILFLLIVRLLMKLIIPVKSRSCWMACAARGAALCWHRCTWARRGRASARCWAPPPLRWLRRPACAPRCWWTRCEGLGPAATAPAARLPARRCWPPPCCRRRCAAAAACICTRHAARRTGPTASPPDGTHLPTGASGADAGSGAAAGGGAAAEVERDRGGQPPQGAPPPRRGALRPQPGTGRA